MLENIFLFIIVLLAYTIKSITGFGNTLVINSLFSFIRENKFITPVDLTLGLPTNIYMCFKDRKKLNYKIVVPLSIAVTIGNIPGIFLLHMLGDKLLKSILGLVLILLSTEMLTRDRKGSRPETINHNKFVIFAVGLISGLITGIYGIGALLAAYISRTSNGRGDYRANLCFVFVIDNIFRFILYCFSGIINKNILQLCLFLAPSVVIGMLIGARIDSKVDDKFIKKSVIVLLLITGIIYILKNRFGLV